MSKQKIIKKTATQKKARTPSEIDPPIQSTLAVDTALSDAISESLYSNDNWDAHLEIRSNDFVVTVLVHKEHPLFKDLEARYVLGQKIAPIGVMIFREINKRRLRLMESDEMQYVLKLLAKKSVLKIIFLEISKLYGDARQKRLKELVDNFADWYIDSLKKEKNDKKETSAADLIRKPEFKQPEKINIHSPDFESIIIGIIQKKLEVSLEVMGFDRPLIETSLAECCEGEKITKFYGDVREAAENDEVNNSIVQAKCDSYVSVILSNFVDTFNLRFLPKSKGIKSFVSSSSPAVIPKTDFPKKDEKKLAVAKQISWSIDSPWVFKFNDHVINLNPEQVFVATEQHKKLKKKIAALRQNKEQSKEYYTQCIFILINAAYAYAGSGDYTRAKETTEEALIALDDRAYYVKDIAHDPLQVFGKISLNYYLSLWFTDNNYQESLQYCKAAERLLLAQFKTVSESDPLYSLLKSSSISN